MNMSQKVFYRMKIIKYCGISVFRLIMLQKPNLLVVDKKRTCKIIDSAVPRDSRIDEKEKEKTEKVSRSEKGVTEDLECESEDYTISCWLFRCYNT